MFCQNCGTQNDDSNYQCVQCGNPLRAGGAMNVNIKNYLVESILVTLCCCLPLGIPAIVFAAQVNGKVESGNIQGAQEAADRAKMFVIIGLILGLVINGLYIGLNFVVGFQQASGGY